MASHTGSVKVVVTSALSNALDIGTPSHSFNKTFTNAFANGTSANQANQSFADTRTLASNTAENLDLAGALTDGLGATITFTSIKAIIISAAAANTTALTIGAGTNPLLGLFADGSDAIVIQPGGTFAITNPAANGYAVTASTGDILKVSNATGASATYDVIIFGEV